MAAIIKIASEPLDEASVRELEREVMHAGAGGLVTFQGVVRDHARGKPVRWLEYEAYPEMAEREMQTIAEEIAARWHTQAVAMVHRVGKLAVGECAVVVSVACAHRAEAFEACRFGIDQLKARTPIWKKEIYEDGEEWVEG